MKMIAPAEMTPADSFMGELAKRVAERVIADLRKTPVIAPLVVGVKGAAIMLDRSEDAIRSMVAAGHLKNCSRDGRVQIAIKDIEIMLHNNKRN
jgi:hypothetical protein